MKKWFPFYKGKCIANTKLGYTTIANARRRMDITEIKKDFDTFYSDDYWYKHTYVIKAKTTSYPQHSYIFCHEFVSHHSLIGEHIMIKDLTGEIKEIVDEYFQLYFKYSPDLSKEENERGFQLATQIDKLGYCIFLYKETSEYDKAFKKFIKDNVEFKEMNVEILIDDL